LLVVVTRQFNVHQVEGILFGSLLTITTADLVLLLIVGAAVVALLAREYNRLLLDSLSPPLASVAGASSAYLDYFFALVLAAAIVVSLKIIGALLVEALVVVPAAAARNVARSTHGYLAWSLAVALAAGVGGLALSTRYTVPTGAAVVLGASVCFFVTLVLGAVERGGLMALATSRKTVGTVTALIGLALVVHGLSESDAAATGGVFSRSLSDRQHEVFLGILLLVGGGAFFKLGWPARR
jgi:hypothetical protein